MPRCRLVKNEVSLRRRLVVTPSAAGIPVRGVISRCGLRRGEIRNEAVRLFLDSFLSASPPARRRRWSGTAISFAQCTMFRVRICNRNNSAFSLQRAPLLDDHLWCEQGLQKMNIGVSPERREVAVALHVNSDKTADLTKEMSSVQAASIKRC